MSIKPLFSKGMSDRKRKIATKFLVIPFVLNYVLVGEASARQKPQAPDTTARWISALGALDHGPAVISLRKTIDIKWRPPSYGVHVSADNRFVLYVNGHRVGEGPARGDQSHWRYETLDLAPFLISGRNEIAARVWNFGDRSPAAQMSIRTGFLLWAEGREHAAVNTNATWTARPEAGWTLNPDGFSANPFPGVGPGERVDMELLDPAWDKVPVSDAWMPALPLTGPKLGTGGLQASADYTWLLEKDALPPMEYSETAPGAVIRSMNIEKGNFPKQPITVAARTHAVLLLDRQTLTTAYPELHFGGGAGAKITMTYAEALIDEHGAKGNRNDTPGKHIDPGMLHDEVSPDGAQDRDFTPLWWRTWRFLQLDVQTDAEPLTLNSLEAHFTAYPFEQKAEFQSDDPDLSAIWQVGWRTLRVNSHETHMDCPYWEQLQYSGDTRIEALLDYVVSGDDRLARQSLRALGQSILPDGLTRSRYPSREFQVIPPFSLLWIGMMHDFALYSSDHALLKELVPATRSVLAWFSAHQRPDGMLGKLPSQGWVVWNYIDASFPDGVPPQDPDGGSVPLTLQFLAGLRDAADLEESAGDPSRAKAYRHKANQISAAIYRSSWNQERQLLADTPRQDHFSQHANFLGVLYDVIPKEKQQKVLLSVLADELAGKPIYSDGNIAGPSMTPATYYFRFYLARAIDHAQLGALYLKLLRPWKEMLARGQSTWAEDPDPTRSEAHAWSAHPTYDLLTIVAGIHPEGIGFKRVRIEPHLGELKSLDASMAHGSDMISVSYRARDTGVETVIQLPSNMTGVLIWKDIEIPLHPGRQAIVLTQ